MSRRIIERVHVQLGTHAEYYIEIGTDALEMLGEVARRSLSSHAQRIALISNPTVFNLYGERAVESLRREGFKVAHWLMSDGERYKSMRTAEKALDFLAETKLERTDAVVALGGGVVGDLAGFAAAIYLRGIDFIQVPTTLLAQIDSSVGGKTGVNTKAGKNLIGAFHQPRAVVIDINTLSTLPRRELTAGFCEAIKQGAVGDRKLFDQTRSFLADVGGAFLKEKTVEQTTELDQRLAQLIAAQCVFKARIVAGDEREDVARMDHQSRRILNFGHTVAHALETVTNYKRFRHGEAVGYGMFAAGEISSRLGLLDSAELRLLHESVRAAGRLPRADDLDERLIFESLALDKKAVGGSVKWILIEELGRARIVDGREIPERVVLDSIRAALAAA